MGALIREGSWKNFQKVINGGGKSARHLGIMYIVLIFLEVLDNLVRGPFTNNSYPLNKMDFAGTVKVHSISYPLTSSVTQVLDQGNKTGFS